MIKKKRFPFSFDWFKFFPSGFQILVFYHGNAFLLIKIIFQYQQFSLMNNVVDSFLGWMKLIYITLFFIYLKRKSGEQYFVHINNTTISFLRFKSWSFKHCWKVWQVLHRRYQYHDTELNNTLSTFIKNIVWN